MPSPEAELGKELVNLLGQYALIAQSPEKFILPFLRTFVDAYISRRNLGDAFGELTQLEQAGVRVVGEITFCQHPDTKQLFIVLLQLGEVADHRCARLHPINALFCISLSADFSLLPFQLTRFFKKSRAFCS